MLFQPFIANLKRGFPLKFVFVDVKKAGTTYPAWPFLFISFSILSILGLVVKKYFQFLIPPCTFHKLMGIPCPTCGFTRMIFDLLELDLKNAFLIQPFMFMVVLFFVLWIIIGFVALIFGKFLYVEIPKFWQKYLWVPLLTLFMLNYIYLIYRGV